MEKRTITRWWIGGLVLVAAGAIVCAAGFGLLLAYGGNFIAAADGYEFIPRTDALFWTLVGLCGLGCVAVLVGLLVQLAAWVGAVVNTSKLADKRWFIILLVSGLLGLTCVLAPLGFAAMVAYLTAGPDGNAVRQQFETPVSQAPQLPTSLAPTN